MFKASCLPLGYDLSDVALAGALCDRASFRRFCGFARDEATPERTASGASLSRRGSTRPLCRDRTRS
jgi:IS5 family transposase